MCMHDEHAPAHVYGVRAEMDGVVQLASRCGLLLVEDCAEVRRGCSNLGSRV
jgi:dTDP-4-amino-4,6-dideoxygalactose transaminase